MTDKPQNKSNPPLDATGEFFTVGNPLHAVRASYVGRKADDQLFETVSHGGYAHVIAPDRSGKSSLIAATSVRLQGKGVRVAVIDLAQISERDGGMDAGRWYYNIAYRLSRQLRLKTDLQVWWQDKSMLSNRQRLVEFFIEVVLGNIQERIVIFIDSIQSIEELPFDEQLLASIRAAHTARITDPEFSRLTFVLLGECDPSLLVSHEGLSPFQVSQQIRLDDFTREQISVYRTELNMPSTAADKALDRIYEWTSGQPHLTQKLARAVAREDVSGDIEGHVDRIVLAQLAGRAALNSEPHLGHIHRTVLRDRKDRDALLNLYGKLRKGVKVSYDPESRIQRKLMALGLLVVGPEGILAPRNKIYASVFTARWANDNLPLHWRGPTVAVAVVLIMMAIPFWYTQILPSSHVDVLTSRTADLSDIAAAYDNLRSFPGHADSADGLYRSLLKQRAAEASDRGQIQRIGSYALRMPDGEMYAADLQSDYWKRIVKQATRAEDRDRALLASIEALIVPTPTQRRIAAALVGNDYPNLLGTVRPQPAERILFDSDNKLLSFVDGARITQWSLSSDQVQQRAGWTLTALEVTPLVRRLVVENGSRVRQVSLEIQLRHERPDDVKIRLIAPSGRTVEIEYSLGSLQEDGSRAFAAGDLSGLFGESSSGTWSLSVRDEAAAAAGSMVRWSLRLNNTSHDDFPDRALPIPDPVARESTDIWFSSGGRYAVARAINSDSARLWDLLYAQPARTVAVPADERVLGLSSAADYLVTARLDAVNLWRIANGRRYSVIKTGSVGGNPELSDDGRFLSLLSLGESESRFELWSVETGASLASLSLAGSVALTALSADGRYLAAADYDRAIRIWDLETSRQVAQIDLPLQPGTIELSPNGGTLAVVYGRQGWALWRADLPDSPLYSDYGDAQWAVKFSPSGSRVIAGNGRDGFQVMSSSDGAVAGPVIASDLQGGDSFLRFSQDETVLLTAGEQGAARFWRAPAYQSMSIGPGDAQRLWQRSGDSISAIAPGAQRIAVGDADGHVHVISATSGEGQVVAASDDISFIGHSAAVAALEFSTDASLVASADTGGTIRIWDAHSGLPRAYRFEAAQPMVERVRFSPSGNRMAILAPQSLQVFSTSDGSQLAVFELTTLHADLDFADDSQLFLASATGELRSVTADRTDSWAIRTVWSGTSALKNVAVSSGRGHVVIVDEDNKASLLNPANGTIGSAVLQLPNEIFDIIFSGSETRVMFRTGRWVHRASIAPTGLIWQDAVRAPKALRGSRLVLDTASGSMSGEDPLGGRIALLTKNSGFIEIATLQFEPETGATIIGPRDQLLQFWQSKLGATTP